MRKILVSGFEPFDGAQRNNSQLIASALGEEFVVLPVEFGRAWPTLKQKIESFQPQVVVALGQAEGREVMSLERIALNCVDARIPDNKGQQPKGELISNDGPDGIFTGLPIIELLSELEASDIPCEISNTAGTYVCNALMYELLRYSSDNQIQSGFVHVPVDQTDLMIRGMKIVIEKLKQGEAC